MILTREQIIEILKSNPHKEMMDFARERNKKLSVHIYGTGLQEYLKTINSFENEAQYAARKQYARSNKDIMERLTRPIDKIFSAKGGSTFYNLPEGKEQEFRSRLKNTENGLSVRRWIEQYAKQAYLCDPMSLIFMEIQDGEPYPTYKSSKEIYTYQPNGRNIDYVIFEVEEKEEKGKGQRAKGKLYRVVDDAYDMLVRWDGKTLDVIAKETYINYFGFAPGFIVSDIPMLGSEWFDSPLWSIIEIADEYLRECSVKSIYKLLHGFPKHWTYGKKCEACGGIGQDKETRGVCGVCNGAGLSKKKWDISEAMVLPFPDRTGASGETAMVAPHVAGYVTPPVEVWSMMTTELEWLEAAMFQTAWGTHQAERADNNTATGKFIDTQPVNDRLSKYADWAEVNEMFVTDCMGRYYYNEQYLESSVHYGRRFTIESPDTIWQKYEKARSSGAPFAVLDDLLREYLQAKYENNSLELMRSEKTLALEPFPHLTIEQVQRLNVPQIDYFKKQYHSDFSKTQADNDMIYLSIDVLQARFDDFAKAKMALVAETPAKQEINNNVELNNNVENGAE